MLRQAWIARAILLWCQLSPALSQSLPEPDVDPELSEYSARVELLDPTAFKPPSEAPGLSGSIEFVIESPSNPVHFRCKISPNARLFAAPAKLIETYKGIAQKKEVIEHVSFISLPCPIETTEYFSKAKYMNQKTKRFYSATAPFEDKKSPYASVASFRFEFLRWE